jgi:Icc-related predicted phosphoesterase
VLTGHIHESPQISHVWKANIGKTTIIQPGQSTFIGLTTKIKTTMVYIEITDSTHVEMVTL